MRLPLLIFKDVFADELVECPMIEGLDGTPFFMWMVFGWKGLLRRRGSKVLCWGWIKINLPSLALMGLQCIFIKNVETLLRVIF